MKELKPVVGGGYAVAGPRCHVRRSRSPWISHREVVARNSTVICCSQKEEPQNKKGLLSFFCPLLRLASGGDLSVARNRWWEVTTSGLASLARLPYGSTVGSDRGEQRESASPLNLYEFEACPFCRRVREAITDLDLTNVVVHPCPKGSTRHRDYVRQLTSKEQFPFLEDPSTGEQVLESADIVNYLYRRYGGPDAKPPAGMLATTPLTGWMPTLFRAGRGMVRYDKAVMEAPAIPLVLYNYENNQFARLVREVLCELELPYQLISAGKGSRNRQQLQDASSATTVPFLHDPNTGAALGDSQRIISYLIGTYSDARYVQPA